MGKPATLFTAALCGLGALFAAPIAQPQQWPTDLPPLLRNGAPAILESAGAPPVIAEGRVKMGDVIAAFPVRYARVGRLKYDVYRTTAFTNSRSLALAAGTVMFRTQLTIDALDIERRARGPAYWCGVPTQAKPARPLCWEEGKRALDGPAHVDLGHPISSSSSPYFPRGEGLVDTQRADFPIIEPDETARADLPPMELVFVLAQADRCPAFVRGGMRVAGKVYILWSLDYFCSGGAKKGEHRRYMSFSAGDGEVCAYGVGNDGANIMVEKQPTEYVHPWGRDVLAERSAERRAARSPEERAALGPDCPPPVSN